MRFDVAKVLVEEILRDAGGDELEVFVFAQKIVFPGPDIEEMREIPVFEFRFKITERLYGWISPVFLHQLPQHRMWNRTFKMKVNLGLRHVVEPICH